MRLPSALVLAAVGGALAAGCASASMDGYTALRQGRYVEAADTFQQALVREPDDVEVLVGLGLAKYRLNDFEEAADAFDRALARQPKHVTARLYLGLARLQRADDGLAEEELGEVARLLAGSRTALQIDRALRVLRGRDPVSGDLRQFMASSIEDAAELERQVRASQAAMRDAELRQQPAITVPIGGSRRIRSPLDVFFR